MKKVLIIGNGLSGLTCAVELAARGIPVTLASVCPPERSQSVMAAGGINAAIGAGDCPEFHIEETLSGGCRIAGSAAVRGLCEAAPSIIRRLEALGVAFHRDADGTPVLRKFGGQTRRRTAYAGTSTGKQLITAMTREARKYECRGLLQQQLGLHFHSALLRDGVCCGALLYHESTGRLEVFYADAVVMATGGQNALLGKTTGSTLCDGYAAAALFRQGVTLKNLEFIQYHPTTLETPQKRLLISEAVRGEGGRLYYLEEGRRVYFMEELYGPDGNLMPRDVVARHIYHAPSQVYLDAACLGKEVIRTRLAEVEELCRKYAGLDISRESIPVSPSVHFFMGGLAVDLNHQTNMKGLYAVGECAAAYHGANRLGGNSLLAALHSARVAARAIDEAPARTVRPDFTDYIAAQEDLLEKRKASRSPFSAMYIRYDIARQMQESLGISRTAETLRDGLNKLDYYRSIVEKLSYDVDVSLYLSYSLPALLDLARAILTAALAREESRGAHFRADFPETREEFACATLVDYENGACRVRFEKEVDG